MPEVAEAVPSGFDAAAVRSRSVPSSAPVRGSGPLPPAGFSGRSVPLPAAASAAGACCILLLNGRERADILVGRQSASAPFVEFHSRAPCSAFDGGLKCWIRGLTQEGHV